MYEQFGAREVGDTGQVEFKLFYPDASLAPWQYLGGGLPRIASVSVVGDVQKPGQQWDAAHAIPMQEHDYTDASGQRLGRLYTHRTAKLAEGFYEYKYYVTFENADPRWITDPCARYGGADHQNAGVVVGGRKIQQVSPIAERLPLEDLVIYELMLDDFTAGYRGTCAPVRAVIDKLDYLKGLGFNAIEFMPWTAWPDDGFSWGYNPFQYFSVAHQYTYDPQTPADKIVYLKELIGACHARDIHVILDGVFNHAEAQPPDRGFAYYWLYQDPADSPYVGNFAAHDYFRDLDYANACVLEYIRDACFYWIDEFKIDGIRFDNTLGFFKPDDRGHGLPKLLAEIRGHLSEQGIRNFSMTLEHSWDYNATDVTNQVGATSCWLDPYRSQSMGYLGARNECGEPQIQPGIMRMLDAGRDFAEGRLPTIYVENHDHEAFILKGGGRDRWWMTQPYLIALFTSPGAVLVHNGQEFGEDWWMPESGNGRVQPRPLRWDRADDAVGGNLRALYQRLIEMRRDHPGLRGNSFYPSGWNEAYTRLDPQGFGVDTDRNVVVYHRWGPAGDGGAELFYVALNFSQQTQHLDVPVSANGPWLDLLTCQTHQAANFRIAADVGSNWGVVLYRKE